MLMVNGPPFYIPFMNGNPLFDWTDRHVILMPASYAWGDGFCVLKGNEKGGVSMRFLDQSASLEISKMAHWRAVSVTAARGLIKPSSHPALQLSLSSQCWRISLCGYASTMNSTHNNSAPAARPARTFRERKPTRKARITGVTSRPTNMEAS